MILLYDKNPTARPAIVTYVAVQPTSTTPVIGASGAIAAVMGAYLVLFPKAPIRTLLFVWFFGLFQDIPAAVLLLFWLVSQFFVVPGSGVAWTAHVGGFVFGALIAFAFRDSLRRARPASGALA